MKAGDVLVVIDPRDYDVAVAKAEADVADAKAALTGSQTEVPITSTNTASALQTAHSTLADSHAGLLSAQRQFRAAEARLAAAESQVNEAQANYKKAADDVARYKLLVDKEEISQQQYDQAAQTAAAAQATVATRIAAVNEARQNVSRGGGGDSTGAVKDPAGGSLRPIGPHSPAASRRQPVQGQVFGSKTRAASSVAGPGQAQPELHDHRRAGGRSCRQEDRGSGPERVAGTAAHGHRSTGRRVGDREFQGDAAAPDAARPAG